MNSAPVATPTYLQTGLYRWTCIDGHVIGDTVTTDPGVHFYPKNDPNGPRRAYLETGHRLDDPLQLARTIEAAAAFVDDLTAD